MNENELRKQKLMDLQKAERDEDIELQKKAVTIAQKLEEDRANELKARSDKIQALISVYVVFKAKKLVLRKRLKTSRIKIWRWI